MREIRNLKDLYEIPCESCIHKNVCNVRECFKETEVKTTHPYVVVNLECTEFIHECMVMEDAGKISE